MDPQMPRARLLLRSKKCRQTTTPVFPSRLLLYERPLDDIVARLPDVRGDCEPTRIQKRASVRKHPGTAAHHDTIFLGVQRRKTEVLKEFARLDQCCETAVVRMRLAADRRVVVQL